VHGDGVGATLNKLEDYSAEKHARFVLSDNGGQQSAKRFGINTP